MINSAFLIYVLPDFHASRDGSIDDDELVFQRKSGLYTVDEQVLLILQCHDALLGGGICFLIHNYFII